VLGRDHRAAVEIGQGLRDAADARAAAARELTLLALGTPRVVRGRVEGCEALQRTGRYVRVASPRCSGEPRSLALDRGRHPDADVAGRLPTFVVGSGGPHRQPEVEPVEERGRQPPPVPGALGFTASALGGSEAARARVGARDEEEVGREAKCEGLAGDPDGAFLEWLSERVERARRELAQLVEEEDTAMSHRRFAGTRRTAPAADE
jgi:hypothetical protein